MSSSLSDDVPAMSDVTGQTSTAPSRAAVLHDRVAVFAPGRLAILIVNWNASGLLLRCLSSLAPLPHRVIVVDNASEDGSADAVAAVLSKGDAGTIAVEPRVRGRRQSRPARGGVTRPAIPAAPESRHRRLGRGDRHAARGACRRRRDRRGRRTAALPRWLAADRLQHTRFPTLGSFAMDLLLIDQVWPGNPSTRRYLARDLDRGSHTRRRWMSINPRPPA